MEEKQEKKYISEKIIDNVAKFCINKKKIQQIQPLPRFNRSN